MSAPQAVPAVPGLYSPDQCQPGAADAYLDHELWTAMADYEAQYGFDALRQQSAENLMKIADGHRRARKAA